MDSMPSEYRTSNSDSGQDNFPPLHPQAGTGDVNVNRNAANKSGVSFKILILDDYVLIVYLHLRP